MREPLVPIDRLAAICHETNRAYQWAREEKVSDPWVAASEGIQLSALAGVRAVLDGTTDGPRAQHEQWMAHKVADGWVHGDAKDEAAKTHPQLVPYDDLSPFDRAKDDLFRAVVLALSQPIPEAGTTEPEPQP